MACAVLASTLVLAHGTARAQSAEPAPPPADLSPSERELSSEQVAAGLTAVREGRWPDARAAFQRAYDLDPQPLTLFNLAAAQSRTGALIAAAAGYRRFLAADDATLAEYRDAATRALAQVAQRIAHAQFALAPAPRPDVAVVVRVDGRALSPRALDVPLPLDPGPHTAESQRDGAPPRRVAFSLVEGERRFVTLMLDAPTRAVVRPRRATSPAWYASPAFWTVVGSVALVAAGGIALGVALENGRGVERGTLPPYQVDVP